MNTSSHYVGILEQIYTNGFETSPRGLKIREIIGLNFQFINPKQICFDLFGREYNRKYLTAELLRYLSGDLSVDFIGKHAKLRTRITNPSGKINSNYGYIVFHKQVAGRSQYDIVINKLKKDKDSRQAIIRYNSDEHEFEGNKDYVCTINNQFLIRENKLYMIVNMRSNDMFYGFQYDLTWFGLLQQSLVLDLKETYPELELGDVIFNSGSSHVYENMFKKCEDIINNPDETKDYELTLTKSLKETITQLKETQNENIMDGDMSRGEKLKHYLNVKVS